VIGLTKTAAGPGNLELRERPERRPDQGEVLLEVLAAGICGTDLHIEDGEYETAVPVTLGHELCGAVSELGEGVGDEWAGARVVAETFFSVCRRCPSCRDGRPNLCAHRHSIGIHVDGAFAPHVIVPVANLHRVPDSMSDRAAALAEPLACVCQCLLDPTAIAPGDRVLVVGPGPIGLIAAQVARVLGGHVVVSGLPSDVERLGLASTLGFEAVTAGDEPAQYDVAIECSGSAGGFDSALAALRKGGRHVQLGIFGRPVNVSLDPIILKELDVHTGFASTPRSWRRAISLMGSEAVELGSLVTSVLPLQQWRSAFEDLRSGRATKIVFDPRLPAEAAG
jgi:L-iditol 2-dehydrogenase